MASCRHLLDPLPKCAASPNDVEDLVLVAIDFHCAGSDKVGRGEQIYKLSLHVFSSIKFLLLNSQSFYANSLAHPKQKARQMSCLWQGVKARSLPPRSSPLVPTPPSPRSAAPHSNSAESCPEHSSRSSRPRHPFRSWRESPKPSGSVSFLASATPALSGRRSTSPTRRPDPAVAVLLLPAQVHAIPARLLPLRSGRLSRSARLAARPVALTRDPTIQLRSPAVPPSPSIAVPFPHSFFLLIAFCDVRVLCG